eukprot:scaffold572_cov229-Amphora_coffeaeformis.AAC.7
MERAFADPIQKVTPGAISHRLTDCCVREGEPLSCYYGIFGWSKRMMSFAGAKESSSTMIFTVPSICPSILDLAPTIRTKLLLSDVNLECSMIEILIPRQ